MTGFVMTYSNVPENDAPIYNGSTTYQTNSIVQLATNRYLYKSLADNNVGNPVTDITKWLVIGMKNRWKMHDGSIQDATTVTSGTTGSTTIINQYQIQGVCNYVTLLGVVGGSVSVQMYTAGGLVYDVTKTVPALPSGTPFNDPINAPTSQPTHDFVFEGLPSTYSYSTVQVIINPAANGMSACAELLFGEGLDVGATQYGSRVGFTDYSVKTTDAFGNVSIVERPYRKTATFQVQVDTTIVDRLQSLLERYRSQPLIYYGSGSFDAMIIYGFYNSFDLTIDKPTSATLALDVIGLT